MGSFIENHLPNELQTLILQSLPDFPSLTRLICASRKLHEVYVHHKEQILKAILEHQIPPELQPEIASLRLVQDIPTAARAPSSLDREYICAVRLCAARDARKEPWSDPVPLSGDFKKVVQFHNNVVDLMDDLTSKCFDHARTAGWTEDAGLRPRQIERLRIQRALYRIEAWYTMCHVYDLPLASTRDILLDSLPPWELDELGCVYDHLVSRVARILEDLAEAHLAGEEEYYRLLFAGDTSPSRGTPHWSESLFLHGLSKVNNLIRISKQAEVGKTQRLLNADSAYKQMKSVEPGLSDISFELSRVLIQKPDIGDDIRLAEPQAGCQVAGPNGAWLWAHSPMDKLDWYQTRKADLGEWCASIWDEERLQDWGVLQDQWSIKSYQAWTANKWTQNVASRKRRMEADPNKPKPLPCPHGGNEKSMPPEHGFLCYLGSSVQGDHEFSTCRQCFDDLRHQCKPGTFHRVKMIRYGGPD
ncbi:MAG: hypothetical protein Q9159_004108 [Coniocarpon cinnabarinum]